MFIWAMLSFYKIQKVCTTRSKIVVSFSGLFGFLALLPLPAEAVINLRVSQVGPDVVVTGDGKANLAALTFDKSESTFQNVLTDVQIFAGPSLFNSGQVDLYRGAITGPATISSFSMLVEEPDPLASSGNLFGIISNPFRVVLPKGYVSNAQLSGVSTFRNVTIPGLGLAPGVGSWRWGVLADGTSDSINLIVSDGLAVPAPLPLAGAAVTLAWSRKLRKRLSMRNKP